MDPDKDATKSKVRLLSSYNEDFYVTDKLMETD